LRIKRIKIFTLKKEYIKRGYVISCLLYSRNRAIIKNDSSNEGEKTSQHHR